MIFPLVLIAALGLVIVDQYKRGRAPTATVTRGGAVATARSVQGVPELLQVLSQLQVGIPPDPAAVQIAIAAAQQANRQDLVQIIAAGIARYMPAMPGAFGPVPALPVTQDPTATPSAPGTPPIGVQMVMTMTPWGPAMVPVTGAPSQNATQGAAAQAAQGAAQAAQAAPPATVAQGEPAQAQPAPAREIRVLPSPFRHVDSNSWTYFVSQLQCEPVDFETKKHIGAFRQRKDRLDDLGIPPPRTADEQYAAFKADLVDSYQHAERSGLFAETVSRTIDADGRGDQPVTPSGVLGVIAAAGLEGAYEWFTNPDDRKRFPGTTKVFLATNGAF